MLNDNRETLHTRLRTICASSKDPTASEMLRAALEYHAAGLSLIPIGVHGNKAPAFEKLPLVWSECKQVKIRSWSEFMKRMPTQAEIRGWFAASAAKPAQAGLAIVGGQVSGGLEILDLDSYELAAPFKEKVERRCPGLIDKLVAVVTPRPGLHFWYRCKQVEGSQKLARIEDPLEQSGWKTVIETKGEGGYCLAPPSPGKCHPLDACYQFELKKDLTAIQTISSEEREVLFEVARSFDRFAADQPKKPRMDREVTSNNDSNRPGDDYNRRAKWGDLLTRHGWRFTGNGGGGEEHWTRPGKVHGCSATVDYRGNGLLHVFSENALPFEASKSYNKFHAYTLLEHDGDFRAAARELGRKGYGRHPRNAKRPRYRPPQVAFRVRRKFR